MLVILAEQRRWLVRILITAPQPATAPAAYLRLVETLADLQRLLATNILMLVIPLELVAHLVLRPALDLRREILW